MVDIIHTLINETDTDTCVGVQSYIWLYPDTWFSVCATTCVLLSVRDDIDMYVFIFKYTVTHTHMW